MQANAAAALLRKFIEWNFSMLSQYFATIVASGFLVLWYCLGAAYVSLCQSRNGLQAHRSHGGQGLGTAGNSPSFQMPLLQLLFICALLVLSVRLLVSALGYELTVDTNCFRAWAFEAAQKGLSGLYSSEMFIDYPPVYIFVLKLLGKLALFLKLEAGSKAFTVLLASAPTLLQIFGAGVFTVFFLRGSFIQCKQSTRLLAQVCAFLFLILLPHEIANANLFGQVDSFCTLLALASMLALTSVSEPPKVNSRAALLGATRAGALFALAASSKPQVLLVFPIGLLFAAMLFSLRALLLSLVVFLLTVAAVYLCAANFDWALVLKIANLYVKQLNSYPYASLNAANLYTLFGQNWAEVTKTVFGPITIDRFGKLMLGASVLFSIVCAFKDLAAIKQLPQHAFEKVSFIVRKQESLLFFSGLIVTLIFTFVDEMHERYLFSAATCFAFAALLRPSRTNLFAAGATVLLSTLNHSLFLDFHKATKGYHLANDVTWLRLLAALQFNTAVALVFLCLKRIQRGAEAPWVRQIEPSRFASALPQAIFAQLFKKRADQFVFPQLQVSDPAQDSRQKVRELIFVFCITGIAALIAFVNLGSNVSPETFWRPRNSDGDVRTYRLSRSVSESKVTAFFGLGKGNYQISISNDLFHWVDIGILGHDTVFDAFAWKSIDVTKEKFPLPYKYLQIKNQRKEGDATALFELAVIDTADETTDNFVVGIEREDADPSTLLDEVIDEQEKVPLEPDFHNEMIFDEVYHVRSAYEELLGERITETTHPPLGKTLISLGISAFGLNPFGWRFVGTLLGVCMIPLFYFVARVLFGTFFAASFAAVLFLFDFMRFTQTRLATLDGIATFILILSFLFMIVYGRILLGQFFTSGQRYRRRMLVLSGLFFGLGIAAKWSVLYLAPVLAVLFMLFGVLHVLQERQRRGNDSHFAAAVNWVKSDWLLALMSFCVLPVLLYYFAFQLSHYRTGEPAAISDFWARQVGMYKYHSELVATHPFSSRWFEWPIIKRPLWLYSGKTFVSESGRETTRSIVSLGNPLIWWTSIPLFLYAIFSLAKKFELSLFIILVAIAGLYLPWVVSPRQLTFIYHFFPLVPFAILLITWCAEKFFGQNKAGAAGGWKSSFVLVYTSLCGLLFALFFPVLSGVEVYKDFITRYLRWFESWIF